MKSLKYILVLMMILPIKVQAISSADIKYQVADAIWQSIVKKLKFCYDKNLYLNDFYRLSNVSNAYELDEWVIKSLSDKNLTLNLVFNLADTQWKAAWFVDPEWAVRDALEKRLYFNKDEIEAILPQYLRYRQIAELEKNAEYIKREQETLNEWETDGYPIFDEFGKDSKLIYPDIKVNSDDIIEAISEQFSDCEDIDVAVKLSINRDGTISGIDLDGPLKDAIKKAITVEAPALYKFEYLDSLVAVPSKLQLQIRERKYGYGINTGWFDIQYNSKKNTWKIKSCGFTQLDETDVDLIRAYLTRLSPNSNLRNGKHRYEFGIADQVLEIGDQEYKLPPVAVIIK